MSSPVTLDYCGPHCYTVQERVISAQYTPLPWAVLVLPPGADKLHPSVVSLRHW